jgi:tetratricopeptide (TPR) repeat protein
MPSTFPQQTAGVAEPPDVRNELGGTVHGPALQIGAVHGVVMTGAAATAERPRQLPLAIGQFTGRVTYLEALNALVPGDAVVITAMDGTAGIGKTMLAVSWAHSVQDRFPGGTLFANLCGYGPGAPATPEEVLDGFLRALDPASDRIPVGVEAKAARFRSLLSGRQVLIVLDNAGSAEQVRPLLPGEPGSMVVVTSRDSMRGLVVTESAHRLTVGLLPESEAVELVARIVGPARAAHERQAVTSLVELCGRLPLAVRIAATRVAASPYNTVAGVVAELADERGRLDVLSPDGDERAAVRAVLGWSYRRLPDDQAILFRRLGLHPGPEFSVHAAAAVAGLEPASARRLVEALAAAHLIEPVAVDRYRCHDLLRAYAAELTEQNDSPAVRRAAIAALAMWYARMAWECDRLAFPGTFRLPFDAPYVGPAIVDGLRALDRLDTERSNLRALLQLADRHGLGAEVVRLAEGVRFLWMRGTVEDAVELTGLGMRAARRAGDRLAEFWFCIRQSENHYRGHDWSEATALVDRAAELAVGMADPVLRGIALDNRAWLHVYRGEFADALPCAQQALSLVRGSGRSEAVARDALAWALNGLGRHEEARRHAELGLAWRQGRDPIGAAQAMHQLGVAWQGLGDDDKAIDILREAITRGRAFGHLEEAVAAPLMTMAALLRRVGREDEAVACWQEAAELYDDYGRPWHAAQARQSIQGLS